MYMFSTSIVCVCVYVHVYINTSLLINNKHVAAIPSDVIIHLPAGRCGNSKKHVACFRNFWKLSVGPGKVPTVQACNCVLLDRIKSDSEIPSDTKFLLGRTLCQIMISNLT